MTKPLASERNFVIFAIDGQRQNPVAPPGYAHRQYNARLPDARPDCQQMVAVKAHVHAAHSEAGVTVLDGRGVELHDKRAQGGRGAQKAQLRGLAVDLERATLGG